MNLMFLRRFVVAQNAPSSAFSDCNLAITCDPTNSKALYRRHQAHLKLGNLDDAINGVGHQLVMLSCISIFILVSQTFANS